MNRHVSVDRRWSPKQSRVLQSTAPYIDAEGGVRAGKTTAAVGKASILVTKHPGIHGLLSRWTEDDTFAELVPKWRAHAAEDGLTLKWHPDEQFDEVVGYGSRVYLRGLRSSDTTSRYAAIRGLDLAFFHVEQAEELPADYWGELCARLSQKGFPHQGLITPQPVNEDHWIAKRFPVTNPHPDYLYVQMNVYDNRRNVGEDYVRQLEQAYPVGSAQRRTLLEGHRGLAVVGDPVYAGYFQRTLHVAPELTADPFVPVIEAWDFGHGHPCVAWFQFLPIGRMAVLGAVMGHNLYLEDFAPAAAQIRSQWFPQVLELLAVGDPMGLDITNQGVEVSKVREILASIGSFPVSQSHANRPEVRNQSVQQTGSYMRRSALDGRPAFAISNRCVVLDAAGKKDATFAVDGYEAGYVWDSRALVGINATIRRPKKDGYYDHFQNCAEYAVLQFGPAMPTLEDVRKLQAREQRRAQRDVDEWDAPGARSRRRFTAATTRGGY